MKVCDALKRLLGSNRGKIEAWTQALKGGVVMPALGGKRKSFPIVCDIVEVFTRSSCMCCIIKERGEVCSHSSAVCEWLFKATHALNTIRAVGAAAVFVCRRTHM